MLTEEERQEIEAEVEHYDYRKAACVEAMKIVQRHRGWVSDDSLRDIAEFLDMTPDELDGLATFYNFIFREPVGRHVILICDSISCWMMGYERLRDELITRLGVGLGETTADGRFTLLPVVCIGLCDHAPVIMIDDDAHVDLRPEQIDEVLAQYE